MDNKSKKNGNNEEEKVWWNGMMKMMSEPYVVLNFMVFFSYIPLRCSASQLLSPILSDHLLHREIQAALAFAVLTVVKIVRQESWEAFTADILFFAKIFLAGIALVIDYRLALWYVLVFLVTYVLTSQPAYQGLGFASHLTPLQLEAILTEGNTSKFWLVEFRALSSSRCIQNSRHFPELSITYSNKNLSFGIVDLGLFPNTAEKFGIPLGIHLHLVAVRNFQHIYCLKMHRRLTVGQMWILNQDLIILIYLRNFCAAILSLIFTFLSTSMVNRLDELSNILCLLGDFRLTMLLVTSICMNER